MAPFFSIILPTYNRAAMLRTAVSSVLAQSCADFECFVIDDGSTDQTSQVLQEFQSEPRLRVQRFPDNRRQHVRRNWALAQARGEFIAFLDSDDVWLPDRLEAFAQYLRAHPRTDFCFSNAYLWRDGRITGTVFPPNAPLAEGQVPGWYAVGHPRLPYLTSNLAVRRALFAQIGRFREDMFILEDTELYARMLASGARVGAIRRPLAVRRLHPGQITHDYRVDYREALMALASSGATEEEARAVKRRVALEVAGYFWNDLRPAEARGFLRTELAGRATDTALYWLSFLPAALLSPAKSLRRLWLRWACHPVGVKAEIREVYRFLSPLLAREEQAGRRESLSGRA
jgi:glycosyltransferase involved in cell wall biosynthesis